jgi:WD40 repeat protein
LKPGKAPKVEPEPVSWQVQPDPASAKVQLPADLKTAIPIKFMGRTLFPTLPSPFVALTPRESKDELVVYDLRQLKPAGVPLKIKPDTFVASHGLLSLSPDGNRLATVVRGANQPTLEVFSFATGKSQRRITVDDAPKMRIGFIDFVANDRLITGQHESDHPDSETTTTYQIWDLGTGKELAKWSHDLVFDRRWATLSPGGNYLVMEHTQGRKGYFILFWDLATGQLAGRMEFQAPDEPWGQAGGLAFSPDGQELAMLWRLNKPDCWGRLMVFDVTTGKKVLDHKLDKLIPQIESLWHHGGTKSLQWIPDRSGWLLFGHLLIDRAQGTVLGKIPPEPDTISPLDRRFLDRDHVTGIEGRFKPNFVILTLPTP